MEFIGMLAGWLWGLPLIIIVLGVGILYAVAQRMFPVVHFGHAMKAVFRQIKSKGTDEEAAGVLSSLQASSLAIGTTVGVGNIGGVAAAVALGGPGAIFWMWIAGLFGMGLKMAEITLGVHYRTKEKNGEAYGGPNYYMNKGIGKEKGWVPLFKALSFIFAFGFVGTYIVSIQTYTVAESVASTWDLSLLWVAIAYTIILYIMIGGGLKKTGQIAQVLVPLMCMFYIVGGIYIILINSSELPNAFKLIFQSAFTGSAALGGFMGATIIAAIQIGMARSVFSNEAGWGAAAMTHSTAKVDHPVKQGMFGVFEVFIDTFIICTITALIIIVTGAWTTGLDGATLTLAAFETGVGPVGRAVLAIGIFLFGITTSTGGYVQVQIVLRYLFGNRAIKDKLLAFYKWTFPLPPMIMVAIAISVGLPGAYLWLIADISTALPIFANLIAIAILIPKFRVLLNDYKARYMGIGEIDPTVDLFYEERKNR